ncbi:MAG: hypothetical protein AAF357_17685, partial [Verrucomicrobiota bacterium]
AVFTVLVVFLDWIFGNKATPFQDTLTRVSAMKGSRPVSLCVVAIACGVLPLVLGARESENLPDHSFPGWPETWEGKFLEQEELTPSEEAFASRFPGKIAVFTTGPEKVIIRWVTRPTRLLHSSADCLRASGFQVETERAGTFLASDEFGQYLVNESIYNDTEKWREVSPWFWAATFKQTKGPWWAVTTIREFR